MKNRRCKTLVDEIGSFASLAFDASQRRVEYAVFLLHLFRCCSASDFTLALASSSCAHFSSVFSLQVHLTRMASEGGRDPFKLVCARYPVCHSVLGGLLFGDESRRTMNVLRCSVVACLTK